MESMPEKNIEILIRARYPLIYIVSFEEMRVIHSMKNIVLVVNYPGIGNTGRVLSCRIQGSGKSFGIYPANGY